VTDPLNAAARGYRRQPAAAGAEVHLERYRALQLGAGSGNLFVLTDWSYRSKINFFLYEAKSSPASRWWKAACAWVTTGRRQV
jgi:iron complex outermembrane receptor protein